MDFSPIINQLVTTEEAYRLLVRLEDLKNSLYGRREDFEEVLGKVNVRYYNFLADGLKKNNRKEYLTQLIAKIKSLDRTMVSLSFTPRQKLAEKISYWLTNQLGRKILVAISIDKSQYLKVGLAWKGKYGQF